MSLEGNAISQKGDESLEFVVDGRTWTFSEFDYRTGNVFAISIDTTPSIPTSQTDYVAHRSAALTALQQWTATLNNIDFVFGSADTSVWDTPGDTVTFTYNNITSDPELSTGNNLEISRAPDPGDYYTLDNGDFRWIPLPSLHAPIRGSRFDNIPTLTLNRQNVATDLYSVFQALAPAADLDVAPYSGDGEFHFSAVMRVTPHER